MDYSFDEVVQIYVFLFKRVFGIDKDIIVITDRTKWAAINKESILNTKSRAAQCLTNGYLGVFPDNNHTLKEVADSVIHELIHIKHPNLTENQVRARTRKFII